MKRMLMMATTAAMIEQFNKNNILILEELGYEVHVLGNFDKGNPISDERLEEFKKWLGEHHGKWFNYSATRSPIDLKNNIRAYRTTVELIKEYGYSFIHCHTPLGSVIARLAGHRMGVKVIYTAHGFHFYKGAPLKNWLLYYPVEKFLSRWTDLLITITKEDYERALRKFSAKRMMYVPGVGIDINKIEQVKCDRVKTRQNIGISNETILIISVGELNNNKNHIVMINAVEKIVNSMKNDIDLRYIIVGKGELQKKLQSEIEKKALNNYIQLLGYRDDVIQLEKAADLFVLPSKREGLSLALMEAMACHIPVICSRIRGSVDLISDDRLSFDLSEPQKLAGKILNIIDDRQLQLDYSNLLEYDKRNVGRIMRKIYNGF
ncbi:MAG: glycosyltransferase [Acetatifactor sp.]|nr:glycosyltransferase [Acetatifactor sp.]